MKKKILLGGTLFSFFQLVTYAQMGINTVTPQKTLHVNGALQVVNELNVGGDATAMGTAGTVGQILKSNGAGVAPSWENLAGAPGATGSIIAVNGEFIVSQEIVVQLDSDYTAVVGGSAQSIGRLKNKIIDNENMYTGTDYTNSFRVSTDGVYRINIHTQLSTDNGNFPAIGVWNNTKNQWVAYNSNLFVAPNNSIQTYTVQTSTPMLASDTYSFRIVAGSSNTKVLKSGRMDDGLSVTQMSVKRLR